MKNKEDFAPYRRQAQGESISEGKNEGWSDAGSGCGPRSLRRYEAGERVPRGDVVRRMMRVYDCEFSVLFPTEILPEQEEADL